MKSPLAVVLDEDPSVREKAGELLARAGIEVVFAATPLEAAETLRARPRAVVVALPSGAALARRVAQIATLCRLTAEPPSGTEGRRVDGSSRPAEALRRRLLELAALEGPVLFVGEKGSGRSHAARCLHAASSEAGPFLVLPAADEEALEVALGESRGTVFVPSIELASWSAQDHLAARLARGTGAVRVVASTTAGPKGPASGGLLSPTLLAAFEGGMAQVPALRERPEDVAVLARVFLEDLRLLNGMPAAALEGEAIDALEAHSWPGNVAQLRGAIESALILAQDGWVRAEDLPLYLRRTKGPAASAERRFRDAKRSVVEAFERSYLEDLLKRNEGNVTGAAEQSGMLRSALQRLLRKHELHSADFRRRGGPDRYAS